MSKTMNWILTEEENGNDLRGQQRFQNDLQDVLQPENDRFWVDENKDKDYIKHCDSLLKDKPF